MNYNQLDLTIKFREQGIAGNQPPDDMMETYIKLLKAGTGNQLKAALEENGIITEVDELAYIKSVTAFFPADVNGIFIRPVMFIGMLCMAASRTKISIMRKGTRSTLIHGTTIIEPDKIYLKGKLKFDARPMPEIGIRREQVMVDIPPVNMSIKWLNNGDIAYEDMETLLFVGQEMGVGGDRRYGYGKFDITKIMRIEKEPITADIGKSFRDMASQDKSPVKGRNSKNTPVLVS